MSQLPIQFQDDKAEAPQTGIGIDAPLDDKGRTALIAAVTDNDESEVRRLLRVGANADQRDAAGQNALYYAIGNKNFDLIPPLLEHGARADRRDALGLLPMDWAITQGLDVGILEELRRMGLPFDAGDNGRTSLHYAAMNDRPEVISYLVGAGLDVNAREAGGGNTPLQLAVNYDSRAAAQMLLTLDADPTIADNSDDTPLHVAIEERKRDMFDLLVRHPAVIAEIDNRRSAYKKFTPLMLAASLGMAEEAAQLIAAGASVNAVDDENRNSLFIAAEAGFSAVVTLCAQAGADTAKAKRGKKDKSTPLHHIKEGGQYAATLRAAILAGCDIDAQDDEKRTAICKAAAGRDKRKITALLPFSPDLGIANKKGQRPLDALLTRHDNDADSYQLDVAQCAEMLLKAGADPDMSPAEACEYAPLHRTVMYDSSPILLQLLERGAAPDVKARTDTAETPVQMAASRRRFRQMMFLLDHGADPFQKNANGENLLHLAAKSGAADAVEYLCKAYPAMAAATDDSGNSPLFYACRHGHAPCVRHLIGAGGDLARENNDGETPLHAAALGKGEDVIAAIHQECLGRENWNVVSSKTRETPLHVASKQLSQRPVEQILAMGGDPTIADGRGLLPAHYAIQGDHPVAAQALLMRMAEKDADAVHYRRRHGWSLLHCASVLTNFNISAFALNNGCDIDAVNDRGNTPLMTAAWFGRVQVVEYLAKKRGARLDIRNQDGDTALDIARKRGHDLVVKSLESAAAGNKDFDPPRNPNPQMP